MTEPLKEEILKGTRRSRLFSKSLKNVHTIDEMKAWLLPFGYSDAINDAAINFILREFVSSGDRYLSLVTYDIAFIDDTDYLEKYKESQDALKKQAARVTVLEKELEEERAEKQKTNAQLQDVLAYIASEERRKVKGAMQRSRKKVWIYHFFLRHIVTIINIPVTLIFIIPSLFCMKPTWVNIATVGGTFIAVEVFINGWLANNRTRRSIWFMKKYRTILRKEIASLGVIGKE